jgi:hypothetical protein
MVVEPMKPIRVAFLFALACWYASGAFAFAADYPSGAHCIAESIDTGRTIGFRLVGQASGPLVADHWYADATRLVWTGQPAQGPLLAVTGQDAIVRDITLAGAAYGADPKERCSVGIHVDRKVGGLAIGRMRIDNVHLCSFRTGLQFGRVPGDGNCDETVARSLSIMDCDAAIHMVNLQSMGHQVHALKVYRTPLAFLVNGGGKLLVDGFFSPTPCTILKLDNQQGIGHNNARYEFRNVYLDNQSENTKLLDVEPGSRLYAAVYFSGVKISYKNYSQPAFVIAGRTSVTVRDAEHLQAGMFHWNESRESPRVLIENCACWDVDKALELFDVAGSRGSLNVTVRDCYRQDGAVLENLETTLVGERE